jgi:hypothetical protein
MSDISNNSNRLHLVTVISDISQEVRSWQTRAHNEQTAAQEGVLSQQQEKKQRSSSKQQGSHLELVLRRPVEACPRACPPSSAVLSPSKLVKSRNTRNGRHSRHSRQDGQGGAQEKLARGERTAREVRRLRSLSSFSGLT